MPNLVIKNVDLALLEKQRKALGEVLSFIQDRACTDEQLKDAEEVEGLLNMLDFWSDSTFVEVRVRVREWFDKVNGNSYFSARLWVEDSLVVVVPLQYGYDDQGFYEAVKTLADYPEYPSMAHGQAHWRYCEENKMKLDCQKESGCLKRDVKAWGER